MAFEAFAPWALSFFFFLSACCRFSHIWTLVTDVSLSLIGQSQTPREFHQNGSSSHWSMRRREVLANWQLAILVTKQRPGHAPSHLSLAPYSVIRLETRSSYRPSDRSPPRRRNYTQFRLHRRTPNRGERVSDPAVRLGLSAAPPHSSWGEGKGIHCILTTGRWDPYLETNCTIGSNRQFVSTHWLSALWKGPGLA